MSSSQNAKLTKQQRRDAAREQARKLREAQQRREKRNRLLIIIGVIVFIAIVVAAIVSIVVAANRAPLEGVDERPSVATEDAAFPVGADGVGSVNDGAPEIGRASCRARVETTAAAVPGATNEPRVLELEAWAARRDPTPVRRETQAPYATCTAH